nr:hypothetical protein [uncultured Clostridium sp.]
MKYANFCDTGRNNINIGDYLQFLATDYLYSLLDISPDEIVYLGFKELENYNGEEVIFPFCYSIIDFVVNGKIAISEKIKPVFFCVTLSTIDKFMDLDEFLSDEYNFKYLLKHSPVGCRDEITYNILTKYSIPAYINGCMTAVFPKYSGDTGKKVIFVDAPKDLLPLIPDALLNDCEFSTQQYHFSDSDITDYRKIFNFVNTKYDFYKKNAKIAITSRLHVALPLAAYGIPVVLAKDNVDGRFSFIEKYISIYDKDNYYKIDWNPSVQDFEGVKELLIRHALGRIQNNIDKVVLERMEQELTDFFKQRTITTEYRESHKITHKNGHKFDEYAEEFWNKNAPIKYALWGVSENNSLYWKNHIESNYPNAKLVAVFDSFREGELFGLKYQHPKKITEYVDVCVIVCSVGAGGAAVQLFKKFNVDKSQYCVTSDCFITENDIRKVRIIAE